MHTTEGKECYFNHKGGFDGNVLITLKNDPDGIEVPFADLKRLVAEWVRRKKIAELEDASDDELLLEYRLDDFRPELPPVISLQCFIDNHKREGWWLFRESPENLWRLAEVACGMVKGGWTAEPISIKDLSGQWRKPTADEIHQAMQDAHGRLLDRSKETNE
jgi:hypothetical protein